MGKGMIFFVTGKSVYKEQKAEISESNVSTGPDIDIRTSTDVLDCCKADLMPAARSPQQDGPG